MNAHIAGPADTSGVTDTLVEAFFVDPVWSWAFADPVRRKAQHRAWFQILVGGAVEHQWVWTTPAHEAVSVWLPPGRPELSEIGEEHLEHMLEETMGERAGLLREVFGCFEASHPRDRDHFYLSLLGTHPDHRGFGIGMELLAANLVEIDALHMPAYLESTNPQNLARYESVGFEVCGTFVLPADGPTVTQMWREPPVSAHRGSPSHSSGVTG
jgi:GNAT superfamily N-acetyltransferase